jgi:hypothetical protein
MALFISCGSNATFSTRFYLLALIALVLVCFCSYCSSSPIASPIIGIDPLSGDIDEIYPDDEKTYFIPFQLPSYHYIDTPEQAILVSNDPFLDLLRKSTLNQHGYQYKKRHVPQAFHAMRG